MPDLDTRIRDLNRAIVAANASHHDIGPTDAERAHVSDLVTQRDALLAEQRRAARRAARRNANRNR